MGNNNLTIAIRAAVEAGNEILNIYNDPLSDFEVERKADHSPLTIADRRAHEVILSFLKSTPYPVLSEEGKIIPYDERKKWNDLWIVDPLDGTKEFIKRNGEFTVNIALVSGGIPVLGVIYVPVSHTLYFAESALGAFKLSEVCNIGDMVAIEELTARSQRLPLSVEDRRKYVVVASRSHLTVETEEFIESLKKKYPSVELVSTGSSIKICLVAEGSADVYPRFAPTMEWDTAAGHAIAKAAGMEMYVAGSDTPVVYNRKELLNPWFIVKKQRRGS